MLEIDGAKESGSGTIFRYALVLSALLKEKIHIFNIRQKRSEPGLRPQHLKILQALQEMTHAKILGDFVGSQEVTFEPKEHFEGKNLEWDIGTAGSTTMLAQALLPLALFTKKSSRFTLKGGVFQDFAPSYYHLQHVLFPILSKMHVQATLKMIRPGYVPKGGGELELMVRPTLNKLKSLELLERGNIQKIEGMALASHLKSRRVTERMAKSANQCLKKENLFAKISQIEDETAIQSGAELFLFLQTTTGLIFGVDVAGKIRRSSEEMGKSAARKLIEDWQSDATVDRYTADQLILYAALAEGETIYRIPLLTDHILSNLWVVEKILKAKAVIEDRWLKIQGIGFLKKNESF